MNIDNLTKNLLKKKSRETNLSDKKLTLQPRK
jgi:hypothetical protein